MEGIEMSDHIPDVTKMISDTPRMEAALFNAPDAGFANIWRVGCDIERELNTANDHIKRLEEAGDALYEGWVGYGFTKDKHLAAWLKAKEDKP